MKNVYPTFFASMRQVFKSSTCRSVLTVLSILVSGLFSAVHAVAPVAGDIIFNEYAADNNGDDNDFFEILVLKNGVDLRGLRFSDNELISGFLNNGESVFIFGNDSYLNNVPKGTIIVVWTLSTNITTDVVVNPAASDWKMVLAPGTGVTTSVDGLGGSVNPGLSNDGEGLYLYLTGPDGNSAGTNIYLDFLSYEGDGGAEPPSGLTDINLTSNADNAYYTGNTAAGNDVTTNWVKLSSLGVNNTPGEPNPTQDLNSLRVVPPQISITEYMYTGGNGEFIEFTNVGSTSVDMTGWSFDDDSRTAGTVSLSAFGMVAPGESVILTDNNAATFRTAWSLCSGIKIIGGLTANLGRNDEINLYNNSNVLVDRLTYGDENISGSIRTQNKSGWVSAAGLGVNDIFQWTLSVANDAEASVTSTGGDIGSPGKSTRATVSFNPCAAPPASAPTIVENTSSLLVNLNASSPGSVSGVISDPSDPAKTIGIDFTINDNDTPIATLTVTAASSNTAVVTNANLNLTGTGASRNLKITPTGVGYTNITVTVSDGPNSAAYIINYAASAASVNTSTTRFHTGASDASSAVAIDADYMFVADDEDQTIRLYDRNDSGLPLNAFNFTSSLGLSGNSEVDIEASTRLGNTIYWMGSHGNNSEGQDRPNRERIFTTTISGSGSASTLSFGAFYPFLEDDLIAWDNANGHGLGAQYLGLQASAANGILPEQNNGFNIEGLTVAPNNTTFYVSFRAPIEPTSNRTKALIVPVTNFTSLPGASSGSATFGAPIFLNLGGRGIRSIERNNTGQYLIIAGPTGGAGTFKFYTWTGLASDQPIERLADLSALNANGSFESIVNLPDNFNENSVIQLLVDNGDAIWYNDGIISKDLGDVNFQKFRSESIALGDPVTFSLSGIIEWSRDNNNGVKDATVNLTVGATDSELSDVDGEFTFDGLVTPGNFTIKPVKNLNKLNGVTVGDALRIQQHITGLNLITDPYDLVAADVNGSNTLTILDATLITQSLNNNQNALNLFQKSWRFVPQSHSMSNPPWGFPEQIDLTNISDDQTGIDFYGIKIGDVVTAFANPSQFAGAESLVFRVQDQILREGETIAVPVRADQLADLAAWQFALHFDTEALSFVSIETGQTLPVSLANFNVENALAGDIRSVWLGDGSNAISEAEAVFNVIFTVQKGGMRLSEVLFLNQDELPALSYSTAMQEMDIRLEYSTLTDTDHPQHTAQNSVDLKQNRPNPFVDVTRIDFTLPQAGPVSLRVFDLAGRLVQEIHGQYPAGANTVLLDMSGSNAFGVLQYELQTPFGVMAKSMVR